MFKLTGVYSAIKAVIFDMDGVLVDSEPIYFEIEKNSFAHFGVRIEEAEHHSYVGVTMESMWIQIKDRHRLQPSIEELLAYHQDNVIARMLDHSNLQMISNIERLILSLIEQQVQIAVASSSSRALIEIILAKIGLNNYFPVIVSGEDVNRGKPEPDIFLHAADILDVIPSSCLVIEDSHNGVKAAKAAGMLCIGFLNENSGKQDLSSADQTIQSYEELWKNSTRVD
ncbi:beta-phosphoglucomutase family hydrolase [Paenibacillus sp. DS2015]|uniref:HAD family hydrolase n=1 Tax=Paenibacillus sp. DS2015 TaxID=3373917 RepID=UPI003D1B6140